MARGHGFIILLSAFMFTACTQLTPEMQVVHDAAEAMGGDDRILEAQSFSLEGSGRQYRLGQGFAPDNKDLACNAGNCPYWEIDNYRFDSDLQNIRWRITQERTSLFLTQSPALTQEQSFGFDGDVAYNIGSDGVARRASQQVAFERLALHYHHPFSMLNLALTEGTIVSALRQEDGHDIVDVTSVDGDIYTLWIDSETKLPMRIASAIYHSYLGDVMLTSTFDNYGETGGLGGFSARFTLPKTIKIRMGDYPLWDLLVETNTNQEFEDLSAPESATSGSPPEFQANVQVDEIADGVWRLAGQSHHSMLVEFDDFLVLIEAPQSDARTLAVIEKARELQPDKPLQYVINTHHHFDHSGGIRAAVSEGLTIITHETNQSYYEELVASSHDSQPDALARSPQGLNMELVPGYEVYDLNNGRRTIHIVRIFQDEHSAGHLIVYLPWARILVEADVFVPTARVAPFVDNLLKNVNDLDWRIDRIVPIHGEVVDFSALEDMVEAEANRF